MTKRKNQSPDGIRSNSFSFETPEVADPNAHAELIRLSEWGCRPLTWLWNNMIPLRKVALLVGDQEIGKTFFTLDLAARVTRGHAIPPDKLIDGGPGSVLILQGDDESDDTLYPRLENMGADMSRAYTLTVDGPRHVCEGRPQINLAQSVECLLRKTQLIGDCRLIVIDPITAFIDSSTANNHEAVRRLFSHLTVVAKFSNAAVLIVSHNRKTGAESVLNRTVGSLAFTIAARVVLNLVEDPAVAGRKLLLPGKMNLIPKEECRGRAFRIHDHELVWDPEPISFRPDELRQLVASGLATSDRMLQTIEWLRDLLKNGPLPSREVHEQAALNSIPRVLLWKAKAKAGVRVVKDGVNRRWCWQLINRTT